MRIGRNVFAIAIVVALVYVWFVALEVLESSERSRPTVVETRQEEPPVGIIEQFLEIVDTKPAVEKSVDDGDPPYYGCFRRRLANATEGGALWTTVREQRVVLFVHTPKCGGSALTAALRRLACVANKDAEECCVNPGFCQRAKPKPRLCRAIWGCHGHNPQMSLYWRKADVKGVTMVREPLSRVVSAWFYRCHNPNFDCYDVPGAAPWAVQVKRARGRVLDDAALQKLPSTNASFLDYVNVSRWPQYHNVLTRMLGADKFPYAMTSVDETDLATALDRLKDRFALVGVFELFDHSVAKLIELAGVPIEVDDFKRVRAFHSPGYDAFTRRVRRDTSLVSHIRTVNHLDAQLHAYASRRLCNELLQTGLLVRHLDDPCLGRASDRQAAQSALDFCSEYI